MLRFQHLRLRARRAPVGERNATVASGCVILGVLAWALRPSGGRAASCLSLVADGTAYDDLWLLFAAPGHAPALTRNPLGDGIYNSLRVDMSYPFGPNDFTGPGVPAGSEFWRPLQLHSSCCSRRLLDLKYHPSYR